MKKIFTERAHLMCPKMSFGITVSIDAPYDENKLTKTMEMLADSHPFLKALLGHNNQENIYYYDITSKNQTEIIFDGSEVSGVEDKVLIDKFDRLTSSEWDLRKEGMLKVISYKNESQTILLLIVHHLLTDGRGAFMLAEEISKCYVTGIAPCFAEERLIESKEDMPKNSRLPFISKLLVNRANNQYKKENKVLSYDEYLKLSNEFLTKDKSAREISIIEGDELKELVESCHEHSVSVNDYLMASMYVNDHTDKIIIAYDLREKFSFFKEGSLGNYSTAFSVVYKKKSEDIWAVSKEVRALVKKISSNPKDLYLVLQCYADLNGGVLDGAFVASRCGFASESSKFIGTMFFGFGESKGYSITNLGKFSSEFMDSAMFIPPASPATKKTQGVITVNNKMIICSSERN